MTSKLRAVLAFTFLAVALAGCKEGTMGPSLSGSITGQVMDFATGEALVGASISTAPPSYAITTDADGRFELDDMEAGNYTLTARKSGYSPSTVTVAVQNNRVTPAVIFLEAGDDDDPPPTTPMITVDVLSWMNQVQGDSTIVFVEYRAHNTGTAPISAYEAYFRIETTGPTYYQQQGGGPLQPGQIQIRNFERYIFDHTGTNVVVDTSWVAP